MNNSKLNNEVKIKVYKVKRAGIRGLNVTLPQVWCDDIGLVQGDRLDVLRDNENRLIIVKSQSVPT